MEVIHQLNAKLDKLIKLDPSQYAASAALLYLKVDGACKKIDLIHKSFVKLVATVECFRRNDSGNHRFCGLPQHGGYGDYCGRIVEAFWQLSYLSRVFKY